MRILLAEDHADSLRVFSSLLAQRGHDVLGATSLAQAKALCGTSDFDLLICSISLADGDGWELAELARRRGANAISLSAQGLPDDPDRSRESGFSAHVAKPFRFETLQQAMNIARAAVPR